MQKNWIKHILVLGTVILFLGAAVVPSFSESIQISSFDNLNISVQTYNDVTEINYQIFNFEKEPVKIDENEYYIIHLDDESNPLEKGKPDIPNICRSIIIPDKAKMEVRVISYEFKEYENILIAPSKGNLLRSVNPDDVPYEFDEIYQKDQWYPENIAELSEPYIVRDFRGQVVKLYPFQYNPVKKTLRFYTDITIEVYPNGLDNRNCIYRNELPDKVDIDYNQIYKRHFINFNSGRYDPVEEQGNMLIITYDDFWDDMVPFLEWKNMKGIPTEMVNVSTIGDANAIKTYIVDYYNDYGLTFVLLAGDAAQVPTLTAGYSASDPSYSYVVGTDHYPDLFVGRFSAQNSDDLITQVERSIEYELYPQSGAEWYHEGVGVASSQGPGDDGEYDYEHIRNIRTKLYAYTYTWIDELYDGSQGGDDAAGNPTPAMVSTAVNDGRSIINYCGHGSPYGWSSSGFSTTDINNLVNDNMLPYVTCVACNNGQFDDYDECFCEAWLRATNNGEPAGAIVATGSSKSMSWNPPMDAQDEFIDLIVETYPDNIKHTIGGIHANGCMHMNDVYGSSGESETDTWHLFGDPSIQIRTDTPESITVVHDDEIDEGVTTFTVTVTGFENALCAVSKNGELLGYGYTDSSGQAIIAFENPINGEETLDLVVTAYNKIPYLYALPVNTNEAPYTPVIPDGPTSGDVDESLTYSTSTTDFEEEDIYYMFDWGDGTFSDWIGPYASGEEASVSNTWTERGVYDIKVKAKDINDDESDWSEELTVSISNKNPNKPTITGKRICTAENTYEFTVKAVDPDGDQMHYYVNWGDNTDTGWVGPFESGEVFITEHSWSETGSFSVRAKAKDIFDTESDWATFKVIVSYNSQSTGFQQILQKLMNRFTV